MESVSVQNSFCAIQSSFILLFDSFTRYLSNISAFLLGCSYPVFVRSVAATHRFDNNAASAGDIP